MEWTQFVIFFIGVFGLFIWNRAESRQDSRHMDTKLESTRVLVQAMHDEREERSKELDAKIQAFQRDSDTKIQAFQNAFLQESKDFHGRLCTLEEKYLQSLRKQ